MAEIKKLPKSEIEIKDEIRAESLEIERPMAVRALGEKIQIDGFRPGHIPESVLVGKVGEMAILEKMAELAISKNYRKILEENKIDAIGLPKIHITKLAKGNPLGFTITVATVPEIKLADYKEIASVINAKSEDSEVTDADVEKVIKEVRQMKAKEEAKGEEPKSDAKLPELDDDYVKKLGKFENLEDFKKKVRENLKLEKEFRAKDKKRLEIIESMIEKSELEVPEVLVHGEAHKMLAKMRADISGMGLKYEDYLKEIGKTEADLEKEYWTEASKRAKVELIISEIAKVEELSADAKAVEDETKRVLEAYKDADPASARMYIESVLVNEEVFKFLEGQK